MSDEVELAPVREGEGFDWPRLAAWLVEHVPGLAEAGGPFEVLQFPGGHANLTYLVRFGAREIVVRRPPLGPVAPRAHDMKREHTVLSALEGHFAAAPRAYALCEDPAVLGATFIAMERCRGSVVRTRIPPDLAAQPDAARRASFALIDAMADFHAVDYARAGLAELGRPEGYAERQVRGWKERWERARDRELPLLDAHFDWLIAHLPRAPASSLVHNDLKLDNCMFERANPDRIVALLDWDMATLGDPLIDLGTLLGYWVEAGDPPERAAANALTAEPGFPTRAELAERYAQRSGIDLASIRWYESFALWKTAIVIQQIYIRFARGQTDDPRFKLMQPRVAALVELAAAVARG
jgi:aminoglycoside phosphotransferase (APT) family kinase protein